MMQLALSPTALEPTRGRARAASAPAQQIGRLIPVYGLLILTVLLIVLFSLLLPQHLPDAAQPPLDPRPTRRSSRMLSLAAMIPMMTGRIDLTVGYGIVLWHILAIEPADSATACPGRWRC